MNWTPSGSRLLSRRGTNPSASGRIPIPVSASPPGLLTVSDVSESHQKNPPSTEAGFCTLTHKIFMHFKFYSTMLTIYSINEKVTRMAAFSLTVHGTPRFQKSSYAHPTAILLTQ